MKKHILGTLFTLASMAAFAQNPMQPVPGQMPQVAPASTMNPEFVQFKEITHDFGFVKQNVPPSHVFTFKNVGNKDITLVNVQASCGCTTPNWKGGVYKPGESGEIAATYNAASEGFFSKVITVTTSEGVVTLTITGTVMNPAAYDEWKAKKDAEEAAKKPADKKKPAKKSGKPSKKPAKSEAPADADKPKKTSSIR